MNYAIKVDKLNKSYGTNHVIKGISFEVKNGEIFGLLGANGAGKTTTLECIEGLRKFDSGEIDVNEKIGVQLQLASLPQNMKAIEAITLFSKWGGTNIDNDILSSLGINELKNKQYRDMSAGQKRRLHLALALIGNPQILFLDEPTAGLDVEGRVALHGEIRKLKDNGKTIVITSHDMAEVESLCDRIAILKDGKIAFIGIPKELISQIDPNCIIHIKTTEGEDVFSSTNISQTLLKELENYKKRKITVLDIIIERDTLEQRFMDISRRND